MQIVTEPAVIDFTTGEVVAYSAYYMGVAPHKTYFNRKFAGFVSDKSQAPRAVGKAIYKECVESTVKELSKTTPPEVVQKMLVTGQLKIDVPNIPGVTTDGVWENPKFGNPERHKLLHGISAAYKNKLAVASGEPSVQA